jgi:hypothetical protein
MKNFARWVFMLSLCGFVGACAPQKTAQPPQLQPVVHDMIDETDVYAVPLDESEVEEQEDQQADNKIIQEEKALQAKQQAQKPTQAQPAKK